MSRIHYAVAMPQPQTHLFHVELLITGFAQSSYELVLPSWTPGSYMIREFARHVQEFEALTAQGEPLAWHKQDKNTWQVTASATGADVLIRYKVYANDLTVRTSHLDTSHGYFNGANLFLYVEGQRHHPLTLAVHPFGDWQVATGLPVDPAAGAEVSTAVHFLADDYDHLVDCPMECGRHRLLSFVVDGVPHNIALWGHGNEDAERLRRDTQAAVQATRDLFGSLPYNYYLFILHLTERSRGGLEHRNSSSNAVSRWSFAKADDYEDVLALLTHEFFHVWNVKRIQPAGFRTPDYRLESYTRLLWVMEGFTTYYTPLLQCRAGLITPTRTLTAYARQILRLLQTPGRHLQSAEAASFDAWIKFYRPDENTVNTSVSYYLKGSLIALLLDLEIRNRTANRRCLDDVLLAMYHTYTLRGEGIPEDGFQTICETVVAGSLQTFFDAYVRGVAELPFAEMLGRAGLQLRFGWKGEPDAAVQAGLGVRLRQEEGRTLVDTVFVDAPAYAADISAGDELVALDGYRISKAVIGERLAGRRPGDRVMLTLFRRDELRQVEIVLAQRPYNKLDIVPLPQATAEQRALYESWLRAPWPAVS